MRHWRGIVSVAVAGLLAGCGARAPAAMSGQPVAPTPAEDCASSTTDQAVCMPPASPSLSESALPLGSGRISSSAKQGYEFRCQAPGGGQPFTTPPWIDTTAKTWSATAKVAVAGNVHWHQHFTAHHSGSLEVLTGNGLPARSGVFPVAASDPAHAYNPDPTAISSHAINLSLPYSPTAAASPRCESGIVGIADNGIPILDGFDEDGNDAAAAEVQDVCHGHPNPNDGYHYHSLSPCLLSGKDLSQHKTVQVGWALDGFGIYVEYSGGTLLTDADLDGCHGRTSVVPWHGKATSIYHYDMTLEFPYVVGCFQSSPVSPQGTGL